VRLFGLTQQTPNCRGQIIVENGLFENMLDDGINVHGSYLRIAEKLAPDTLVLEFGHPETFGLPFAFSGVSSYPRPLSSPLSSFFAGRRHYVSHASCISSAVLRFPRATERLSCGTAV
jgi:hypothetical protein